MADRTLPETAVEKIRDAIALIDVITIAQHADPECPSFNAALYHVETLLRDALGETSVNKPGPMLAAA